MLKPDIIAELSGKRIFLTGGTGFFGKSILDYFTRHPVPDMTVAVLARHTEKFRRDFPELCILPGLSFLSGDVRDFPFPPDRFDYVIHAATPAVTTLVPGEMRSIIEKGTKQALRFADHCGAVRFLLTSSGAVYGPQPPDLDRIPEDFPCRPVTEYGIAKLAAEHLCRESGQYVLLARCFSFIGRYLPRDIHYAAGNFLRDCEQNRPITILGDGRTIRSYLYADDLVEWLFTLLIFGRSGIPYNIGSEDALSIQELAERLRDRFGTGNEIRILRRSASVLPSRYVPSTRRIREELGVEQNYDSFTSEISESRLPAKDSFLLM